VTLSTARGAVKLPWCKANAGVFGGSTNVALLGRVWFSSTPCNGSAFSVWTQFTVSTGIRSELPRGMPLVTRVFASSEHAWDPMASSSVNFCQKTRTVHCLERLLFVHALQRLHTYSVEENDS
jgi:hypothetical protein